MLNPSFQFSVKGLDESGEHLRSFFGLSLQALNSVRIKHGTYFGQVEHGTYFGTGSLGDVDVKEISQLSVCWSFKTFSHVVHGRNGGASDLIPASKISAITLSLYKLLPLEGPELGDHQQGNDQGQDVEGQSNFPIITELVISDALHDQVGLVTDGSGKRG